MSRRVIVEMNPGAEAAAPAHACPGCASSWASPAGYTTRLIPYALCRCRRRHHELRCSGCGREFVIHREGAAIHLIDPKGALLRYCREQDRLAIASEAAARFERRG